MKMRTVIFICAVLACINAQAIERQAFAIPGNLPPPIKAAINELNLIFFKIFEFCKEPYSTTADEIQTNAESTRQTFQSYVRLASNFSTEEIDGKKVAEKMAPVIEWVDQCYREIDAENDCQKCREKFQKKIKPEFYADWDKATFEGL